MRLDRGTRPGPRLARWIIGAAIAICAAGALPATALAQAGDTRLADARTRATNLYPTCSNMHPSAADVDHAATAHEAATSAYSKEDWKTAIDQWNSAFQYDCTRPSVFNNLAMSYSHIDLPMAIAVLEIYAMRDPTANQADASDRIARWKMQAGIIETPADGVKPTSEKDEKAEKHVDASADLETKRPFGPGPWILFGVGSAALLTGVAVLTVGRINVNDAEAQCGGHTNCTQPEIDLGTTGNTLTGAGAGLLGGGAAIAIGGLIWQFVGNKPVTIKSGNKSETTGFLSPRLTFEPSFGPGLTGGALHGSF
ncbi:MAG: hypothetical protein U0414_18095 [Polyangiaceae bacterium]